MNFLAGRVVFSDVGNVVIIFIQIHFHQILHILSDTLRAIKSILCILTNFMVVVVITAKKKYTSWR